MKKLITLIFLLGFFSGYSQIDTLEYNKLRQKTEFTQPVLFDSVFYFMPRTFPSFNPSVNYVTVVQQADGTFKARLAGGGGGASDSTRLIQDSILVYYQAGVILGRDTIRLPSSGGGGGLTSIPIDSVINLQDSLTAKANLSGANFTGNVDIGTQLTAGNITIEAGSIDGGSLSQIVDFNGLGISRSSSGNAVDISHTSNGNALNITKSSSGNAINVASGTVAIQDLTANNLVYPNSTTKSLTSSNIRVGTDSLILPATAGIYLGDSSGFLLRNGVVFRNGTAADRGAAISIPSMKDYYVIYLPDSAPAVTQNSILYTKGFILGNPELGWKELDVSAVTGLQDSLNARGGSDSDWLLNSNSLYNNTNSIVVNNDTTNAGAKFEVWGYSPSSPLLHLIRDSSGLVNYQNTLFTYNSDTAVTNNDYECSVNFPQSLTGNVLCTDYTPIPSNDTVFFSRFNGDNHLTFQLQKNQLFKNYWFQVGEHPFTNVRPYDWYVLGSTDNVTYDTIQIVNNHSLSNYFPAYPTLSPQTNGQYFTTTNNQAYQYIRFVFDTIAIASNGALAKVGAGGVTVQLQDFQLFGIEKTPLLETFGSKTIKLHDTPYQSGVDTLLGIRGDTVYSTLSASVSAGDNLNKVSNTINLDSNVNIRNKITTSLVRDTLVGDTLYTLDVTNKQAYHITLDTNAILFDYVTSDLIVGQPFDITVVLESDTAKAAQTAHFTSGKFYFAGGTAPTINNTNTNSKRRNILQFKFDGVNQRLYVLSIEQWEEN